MEKITRAAASLHFALQSFYTSNKIIVRTIPASVKYRPFLKMVVFGINIQKEEITKNNKPIPKKILR
jgi:hypothetical protein